MATTMCLLLLVPALLLLLSDLQIIQCGGMSHDDGSNLKGESALGKPSNVTVSCLNLNYTLHWNPPSSSSEDGTVYYTVYYFGLGFGWLPLPSCVNITQHSCYIFPVFNTHDDVFRDLKVSVQAHDEAGSTGAPANVTFNPLTNATVGAPTVTLPPDKIGPYEAVAYLKAPISPIGDTVVTQQLTEISIKYNISVWKQTTKILEKSLASSIDMTHLTDLRPDTSYELRVFTTYDTMYGMKYSPDVATSTFTTKQKSPSYGPDIFLGRISEPNCAQPNIRNVTIKWKAPPVDSWNGQITNYTLMWREQDSAITSSHTVTDLLQLSHTLVGLSRWKLYQVSVSANNNGGATPSAWLPISADIIDKHLSQPEDLQVQEGRDSLILVSWQPPNDYPECIVGYHVIYQWEGVDGKQRRQIIVYNTSYHMEELEPAIYTFEVASEIQSGDHNYTIGLAASTTYPQTGDNGGVVIRWPPIVAVLAIVIVVSFGLWICLWKRKKLKRFLGLHNLFHLDEDNKIIRFAQNYTSPGTPVKRVEPELFDAIVTSKHPCPNADENGSCSNTNCSCSTTFENTDEDKLCKRLLVRRDLSVESNSSELPVLTPDIGWSCFHFPDFTKKSHNEKEGGNLLLENQPLVKRNNYLKVGTGELNQVQLSLSMNDLYLRSHKPETDMDSESSQLLSAKDEISNQDKVNINPYCQMSQIPHLRNIKYSRLNSYSDTDVSCDVNVSNFGNTFDNKDNTLPLGYENGPTATQSTQDAYDTSPGTADTPGMIPKPCRVKRQDSYPYSKLAFGENSVPVKNIFNDTPEYIGCDKNKNCPADRANDNTVVGIMLSDVALSQEKVANSINKSDNYVCDSKEILNLNCGNVTIPQQQQDQVAISPYVQHGSQPSSPPPPASTECNKVDEIEPYILISEL